MIAWQPTSFLTGFHDEPGHRVDDTGCSATVDTSAQRQEVTLSPGSPKVVPEPTCGAQGNLLLGRVVVDVANGSLSPIKVVAQSTIETKTFNTDTLIGFGLDGLHPPATLGSMSSDSF